MKTLALITLALSINTAMAADILQEQPGAQAPQHGQHPPRTLDEIPKHELMYVMNDDGVQMVDLKTRERVGDPIRVGRHPTSAVLDPNTHYLYVANQYSENISVINTATNTVVGDPIPVPFYPTSAVLTPNGYLYVINREEGTISAINTENNNIESNINVEGDLVYAVFNVKNNCIYVINRHNVVVINTETNQRVGDPIPVGREPRSAVLDPHTGYLYVMNEGDRTISVINTRDNNTPVGDPIQIGHHPQYAVLDPHTGYLYVTHEYSDNISVINTRDRNKVMDFIQLANPPLSAVIPPLEARFGKTKSARNG